MKEMLPSLLILERTLVVQGTKEEQGPKERRASVTLVTSQVTMLENALSRRILPMMMTTRTTRGMAIKGKQVQGEEEGFLRQKWSTFQKVEKFQV